MKKFHLFSTTAVLLVSLFLFSCKKDISAPLEKDEATSSIAHAALQATAGDCTPIALGVYSQINVNNPGNWKTIMQRFYDPTGSLTNIKAFITFDRFGYTQAWLDLQWGVVTFQDNQVYITDGLTNKLIMRVTLNDSGLPEATYYYTDPPAIGIPGTIDTSYYYYTGNRLDHIFQSSRFNSNVSPNLQTAFYTLDYDAHGNIALIGSNNPGAIRMSFSYDYDQPINGFVTNYYLTQPLQLLELMGLLNLPMMHQPTEIVAGLYSPGQGYPNDIQPLQKTIFNEVVYTDGGQVYSWVDGGVSHAFRNTYYHGYHCLFFPPPGARMPNVIGELQDFKKQFPVK
jgi:hypothetical protein